MSVKHSFCAAAVMVAALSAFGGGAQAAGPAAAAGAGDYVTPVILIVDTEKVLSECKAMKGLQGQIDTQQQALKKEFGKKQEDLQSADLELRKEQSTAGNSDAFQDKVEAFRKRVAEAQRDAASRKQALSEGVNMSVGKVKQSLIEVVRDIATERHATMVLQSTPFLIFEPAYDVSADALRRLDVKMGSVALVVPKVPAGASVPGTEDASVLGAVAAQAPATAPAPAKKK
jgi:outer membrane protein